MERRKHTYRNLKPLDEAKALLAARFCNYRVGKETVPVRQSLGRVLAEAVKAKLSVPSYHAAAMDGIAVRASSTFGALPERPVILQKDSVILPKGRSATVVDTGDPMPEGMDAVVMIEKTEETGDGWEIREAVYPWQNVRKAGEDFVKGDIILPALHRIRPFDQGAMLAAGVLFAEVFKKPKVLIIPTGDEIVLPEDMNEASPKGALPEVNGQVLASMSEECGAEAVILNPVPDDPELLERTLVEGLETGNDVIMMIAGSSAGREDFTPGLLQKLGELLVHGVTVMPGKPTLLAEAGGRPVIGIPGYPVSAIVCFREFVRPLLYSMQGLQAPETEKIRVAAAKKIPSKLGLEEQVRVIIGRVGERAVAMPLSGGAGTLSSIVRADGIVRIPQESSGLAEGEETDAELLIPSTDIENNLLVVGSHDMTIDILAGMMEEKTGGRVHISSSNVGSLGGLMAIKKQIAHFAGSHLLDAETGDYNFSYIKRYLPEFPVVLLTLVHRYQGFIIKSGNPRGIKGIEDLTRTDIVFVNRQAGSGTRILLDYELKKAEISPLNVLGYRNEEYTHINVAMAVASGAADVGMGISAAAAALSLDFIPLAKERYDLLIPEEFINDDKIKLLLEIIRSEEFKNRTMELGGYEVEKTGEPAVPQGE